MAKALATLPARTLADGGCALKEAGHAAFVLRQLGANLPQTCRQLAAKDVCYTVLVRYDETAIYFWSSYYY
eukprot:257902-Amorphochlora_amoeboformis.AAC.1